MSMSPNFNGRPLRYFGTEVILVAIFNFSLIFLIFSYADVMPRTVPSLILASCVEEKWQAAAVVPWSIAYLAILALLLVLRSNSHIFSFFLNHLQVIPKIKQTTM